MKRISRIILIALLCTICLVLVACGDKIDSIYFEKEPRKTYVQGQDFTLDDSVLMGLSGDEASYINGQVLHVNGGMGRF